MKCPRVKDDCPKGYKRTELAEIAKRCSVSAVGKSSKQLCADIKKALATEIKELNEQIEKVKKQRDKAQNLVGKINVKIAKAEKAGNEGMIKKVISKLEKAENILKKLEDKYEDLEKEVDSGGEMWLPSGDLGEEDIVIEEVDKHQKIVEGSIVYYLQGNNNKDEIEEVMEYTEPNNDLFNKAVNRLIKHGKVIKYTENGKEYLELKEREFKVGDVIVAVTTDENFHGRYYGLILNIKEDEEDIEASKFYYIHFLGYPPEKNRWIEEFALVPDMFDLYDSKSILPLEIEPNKITNVIKDGKYEGDKEIIDALLEAEIIQKEDIYSPKLDGYEKKVERKQEEKKVDNAQKEVLNLLGVKEKKKVEKAQKEVLNLLGLEGEPLYDSGEEEPLQDEIEFKVGDVVEVYDSGINRYAYVLIDRVNSDGTYTVHPLGYDGLKKFKSNYIYPLKTHDIKITTKLQQVIDEKGRYTGDKEIIDALNRVGILGRVDKEKIGEVVEAYDPEMEEYNFALISGIKGARYEVYFLGETGSTKIAPKNIFPLGSDRVSSLSEDARDMFEFPEMRKTHDKKIIDTFQEKRLLEEITEDLIDDVAFMIGERKFKVGDVVEVKLEFSVQYGLINKVNQDGTYDVHLFGWNDNKDEKVKSKDIYHLNTNDIEITDFLQKKVINEGGKYKGDKEIIDALIEAGILDVKKVEKKDYEVVEARDNVEGRVRKWYYALRRDDNHIHFLGYNPEKFDEFFTEERARTDIFPLGTGKAILDGFGKKAVDREGIYYGDKEIIDALIETGIIGKPIDIIEGKLIPENQRKEKCVVHERKCKDQSRNQLVELALQCGLKVKSYWNESDICKNLGDKYGYIEDKFEMQLPQSIRKKVCDNVKGIMQDNVEDIPKDKIVKLLNGRCYDIDNVVSWMISQKDANVDPLDPTKTLKLWKDETEKVQILTHPNLDPDILKAYDKMIEDMKKEEEKRMEMMAENLDMLSLIGRAGFISLSDNPSSFSENPQDFDKAQKILIELFDLLQKDKNTDLWLSTKALGIKSLGEILGDLKNQCIHGVGFKLLWTYIYLVHLFKTKYDIEVPIIPVYFKVNNNFYLSFHLSSKTEKVKPRKKSNKNKYEVAYFNLSSNRYARANILIENKNIEKYQGDYHDIIEPYLETHKKTIWKDMNNTFYDVMENVIENLKEEERGVEKKDEEVRRIEEIKEGEENEEVRRIEEIKEGEENEENIKGVILQNIEEIDEDEYLLLDFDLTKFLPRAKLIHEYNNNIVYQGIECELDDHKLYSYKDFYIEYGAKGESDDIDIYKYKVHYYSLEEFIEEAIKVIKKDDWSPKGYLGGIERTDDLVRFFRRFGGI